MVLDLVEVCEVVMLMVVEFERWMSWRMLGFYVIKKDRRFFI